MRRLVLAVLVILVPAGAAPAAAQSGSHFYVSPTLGWRHWDGQISPVIRLDDNHGLLYGGRVGYSPIEAFAGELVFLTGTNTARVTAGTTSVPATLRLTQTEFSFLVNFQSIASERIYPFLDLGVGLVIRGGNSHFDDTRFAFHLGGGLKTTLAPRWALRVNARDTFFTDTQTIEGVKDSQVTVDSVELSLGVEYRFWTLGPRGGGRLR